VLEPAQRRHPANQPEVGCCRHVTVTKIHHVEAIKGIEALAVERLAQAVEREPVDCRIGRVIGELGRVVVASRSGPRTPSLRSRRAAEYSNISTLRLRWTLQELKSSPEE
jgi:hypothetical protein